MRDSEIFEDGQTDCWTHKGDYYGPNYLNPESKISA